MAFAVFLYLHVCLQTGNGSKVAFVADESRRLIKGMMARVPAAIRDAGDDLDKVDCTKQVEDDDLDVGQRARDHLQHAEAETAVEEVDAIDAEAAVHISDDVRTRFFQ